LQQLLHCGLLRGSFAPPRAIRELRDWTRQWAQLAGEHTCIANRIHKLREDTNIQLGAVAWGVLGVSWRAMLRASLDGQEAPQDLAELAQGRLRKKLPQRQLALEGHLTGHHRFLLGR